MKYLSDIKSEKIRIYINGITKEIEDFEAGKEIEKELISHIGEKLEVFLEMGYSEEEAADSVLESMGKCEETAQQLKILHPAKVPWKYDIIFNLCTLLIPIFGIMLWLALNDGVPRAWIEDLSTIKINLLTPLLLLIVNIHFSHAKKERFPIWRILICGASELTGYIISRLYLCTLMSGAFPDICYNMMFEGEKAFVYRDLNYLFAGSFILTILGLSFYQFLVLKGKNLRKPVIITQIVAAVVTAAIILASYIGIFTFGDRRECADIVKRAVMTSVECGGDYKKCPDNIKAVISDKSLFNRLNFGMISEERKEYENAYHEEYSISNPLATKSDSVMLVKYTYSYEAYESAAKTSLIAGAKDIGVIVTLENKGDNWKITDIFEHP